MEDDEQHAATETSVVADEFGYDYVKSNLFRVIHVDGVWGGLTPKGKIAIGFFNERPAVPKSVIYPVLGPHQLGDENVSRREGRANAIREMEVLGLMDLDMARALKDWLEASLDRADAVVRGATDVANSLKED